MEEFTREFYHFYICVDHQEIDEKMDARYVNCLIFSIQDELSMHRVQSVEEAYMLSIKYEEKQNRQFAQRNRGARRGTLSASQGGFNYGRGESSQGFEKAKDTRQGNFNQPRGRGSQRGRGYGGGRGRPYWCFRCGVEGHQAFYFSKYTMQYMREGQQPSLKLVQVDNEEGVEYKVMPNMGGNIMI